MPQLSQAVITQANSASAVAASCTASIGAVTNQSIFLCGIYINGTGATGASVVTATLTGLTVGTLNIQIPVPAAAGGVVPGLPIVINFPVPMVGVNNSAVALAVPSFGAGSTGQSCMLWGFSGTS